MTLNQFDFACLRRDLFLAHLCALMLFCGSGFASEAEDKGAAYEFFKTDIEVNGNKFKTTRHVRLNILNARGDEYASFYTWVGRWTKLKDLSISVFKADGTPQYVRHEKDLTKTCGVGGYSLYTDICHLYTELKAPSYPYTIEYEYTTESKSLFELRGAPFQHGIPVDLAEIRLVVDSRLPLRWKLDGMMDLAPEIQSDGDRISYLWRAAELDGTDDIEYVPDGFNEPARLVLMADQFKLENFTFVGGDWTNVGKFYRDLAADRYLPLDSPPSTLTISEQRDSLKSIYEDVINSTRYVAIQIGIGGWQPYSAELTRSRGYGDCKDLSTLLVSRLRQVGIEAYPALLNTRGNGLTDPNFPSLSFNHVITAAVIADDTTWLDPTCGKCPLGEIPYADEQLDLLLITNDGGLLTRTPTQDPGRNSEMRDSRVNIGADLSVTFETRIEYTGEYATRLRSRVPHLTADETPLYFRDLFADTRRKVAITDWEIENLEDINRPLILNLTGTCRQLADLIKNEIYCRPMFLDQPSSYETTTMKERSLPINTYYPDHLEHLITLTWDDQLPVIQIDKPDDIRQSFPFGSVICTTIVDSTSVTIEYTKECTTYQVETEELEQFRQFQTTLKQIANQYISLRMGD